ncbi:hypothetical protein H8959_005586 [Pygathrix nigripes]
MLLRDQPSKCRLTPGACPPGGRGWSSWSTLGSSQLFLPGRCYRRMSRMRVRDDKQIHQDPAVGECRGCSSNSSSELASQAPGVLPLSVGAAEPPGSAIVISNGGLESACSYSAGSWLSLTPPQTEKPQLSADLTSNPNHQGGEKQEIFLFK